MSKSIFKLLLSIILCESAGLIGSFFTISAISTWYKALNKPSFSPPNFLFGPVWTILYILMGISFYLIWIKLEDKKYIKRVKNIKNALKIFLIHLFFNASWSIVFFGMYDIFLAFINILIIWVFIIVLIFKFSKIDQWSSIFLVPYFLWVSFATILNLFLLILN